MEHFSKALNIKLQATLNTDIDTNITQLPRGWRIFIANKPNNRSIEILHDAQSAEKKHAKQNTDFDTISEHIFSKMVPLLMIEGGTQALK